MTMHATRDGQNITVHGNTDVEVQVQKSALRYVKITETAQHLRSFHTQLGQHLDEAEAELAQSRTDPETL